MSPDGAVVAAGGWTGSGRHGVRHKIYLFDREGQMVKRIDGLPNVVHNLAFSRDGRFLAAGLHNKNGIRIFDRERDWAEAARDTGYGDSVYGLDFAGNGGLATTSIDGHIRLYDAQFRRIAKRRMTLGRRPLWPGLPPRPQTACDRLYGQARDCTRERAYTRAPGCTGSPRHQQSQREQDHLVTRRAHTVRRRTIQYSRSQTDRGLGQRRTRCPQDLVSWFAGYDLRSPLPAGGRTPGGGRRSSPGNSQA